MSISMNALLHKHLQTNARALPSPSTLLTLVSCAWGVSHLLLKLLCPYRVQYMKPVQPSPIAGWQPPSIPDISMKKLSCKGRRAGSPGWPGRQSLHQSQTQSHSTHIREAGKVWGSYQSNKSLVTARKPQLMFEVQPQQSKVRISMVFGIWQYSSSKGKGLWLNAAPKPMGWDFTRLLTALSRNLAHFHKSLIQGHTAIPFQCWPWQPNPWVMEEITKLVGTFRALT